MSAALVFDRVTKRYRGGRRYRALRDDLVGTATRLVGVRREPRPVVTALDDLCLEVPEGQAFGLIGANGAGKTTALRIASRITYPTEGRVRVRGRVGSLIEVGTGMHPELTGRENIRLYGRILGFSARDIASRFDEIVSFAEIERAVDQPVKQYSSGMQLRLGFSLAAHLEPDVLLVDEALAVGDVGFQYRCVERMARIVREGGTLVFVTHDMTAIESLCTRAVLLAHGRVLADGPARDVVAQYLRTVDGEHDGRLLEPSKVRGRDFEIVGVTVLDALGRKTDAVRRGEPVTVRVAYVAHVPIPHPSFSIGFGDGRLGAFSSASMLVDGETPELIHGPGHVDCTFTDLPLRPRSYEIWLNVRGEHGFGNLITWQPVRMFEVVGEAPKGKAALTWGLRTPVEIPYRWSFESDVGEAAS